MWDKIKAWFKHSLTILWARAVALAGLLLAAGQSVLQDPNVNGAIQTALQPKFIPYYVIAIGLITEIARRRTAGPHPNPPPHSSPDGERSPAYAGKGREGA